MQIIIKNYQESTKWMTQLATEHRKWWVLGVGVYDSIKLFWGNRCLCWLNNCLDALVPLQKSPPGGGQKAHSDWQQGNSPSISLFEMSGKWKVSLLKATTHERTPSQTQPKRDAGDVHRAVHVWLPWPRPPLGSGTSRVPAAIVTAEAKSGASTAATLKYFHPLHFTDSLTYFIN